MIEFFIPDNRGARPQKRHYTARIQNGRVTTFDPSAQEKKLFAIMARRYAPNEPLAGPLRVNLVFHMPIRETRPQPAGSPCAKSPDIDNMAKFALDAMNKIFYHDDRQIYSLMCKKVFSDRPGTYVEIQSVT